MPIVVKTYDRRGQQRLLLCRDRAAAEVIVNVLYAFHFPVATEWCVVYRDPVDCYDFVTIDGQQYYLHPRSWGAELKPYPPKEGDDDVLGGEVVGNEGVL